MLSRRKTRPYLDKRSPILMISCKMGAFFSYLSQTLWIQSNIFAKSNKQTSLNYIMTRYLKNMEKEIIIDNNIDEIIRITQFIEELGLTLQLPSGITMSVNLAIEEAISNIIRHAYPLGKQSDIILRVNISPGLLTFLIIDDGLSFDPSQKTSTEETVPLEQRLTEGLGLFLIRRTMDEIEYNVIEGRNHLVLKKNIDADFKQEATLKTNLCKIEGVTILSVEGRLDTANASEFNTIIHSLLSDSSHNIIINCEGLTYISSSGLRCLIVLQKSVTHNQGSLSLEAMRPEIRKIFDMTGCSSLFTIR